jgi:hypothetical protein
MYISYIELGWRQAGLPGIGRLSMMPAPVSLESSRGRHPNLPLSLSEKDRHCITALIKRYLCRLLIANLLQRDLSALPKAARSRGVRGAENKGTKQAIGIETWLDQSELRFCPGDPAACLGDVASMGDAPRMAPVNGGQ